MARGRWPRRWVCSSPSSNTAFDSLIPDLDGGRCDIVWTALYISDKRLEVADAVPYLATGQQVMVPKGNPQGIASLDDLCGKNVAIQSGGLVESRLDTQSTACTDAGKPAINNQGYPRSPMSSSRSCSAAWMPSGRRTRPCRQWMTTQPRYVRGRLLAAQGRDYGVYYTKGADGPRRRPSRLRSRRSTRTARCPRSRSSTARTRPPSTPPSRQTSARAR